MKTLGKIVPVCNEDLDEIAYIMPVCITLDDFNRFMALNRSTKRTAQAWADLQTAFWKFPQNTPFN